MEDAVRLAALRALLRAVLDDSERCDPPRAIVAVLRRGGDVRDVCAVLQCSRDEAVAWLARIAVG